MRGAQYERFKANEVARRNLFHKLVRAFPLVAAALKIRNRGISAYNESDVVNKENAVKSVLDVENEIELMSDIDFKITIGKKTMVLRANSREEKKLWVIALNGATTVRSFT